MRWSMLPISVAFHALALLAFFVIPLAADVDMPTPWPVSAVSHYVAAAAVPPQAPSQAPPTRLAPVHGAPTSAPDRILPELPPAVTGPTDDWGLPDVEGGMSSGVPVGLRVDVMPPPPPPPAPERPAPLRAGGLIHQPKKVVHVAAEYPEFARAAKVEGLVIVEATIDERGFVTDARVLRSVALLDGAALAAVKQWRYTPTLLNGVPVRVLMTVTFDFRLGGTP
jgi:protein TonB